MFWAFFIFYFLYVGGGVIAFFDFYLWILFFSFLSHVSNFLFAVVFFLIWKIVRNLRVLSLYFKNLFLHHGLKYLSLDIFYLFFWKVWVDFEVYAVHNFILELNNPDLPNAAGGIAHVVFFYLAI